MTLKQRQTMLAPDLDDGVSLKASGAPATVKIDDKMHTVRRVRLTMSSFVIAIAEADDYGGTKLCDLPDSNLAILGAEMAFEAVKGEETGGLVAATDIVLGLGTAVASASTLATTMQDVINLDASYTGSDASPAVAKASNENTTPAVLFLDDASTNALYLNLTAAITTDDTLTCTGTVDILYVDLGNEQ